MTADEDVIFINYQRVIDAELSYVLGDQEYLVLRMPLGIFWVSFNRIDWLQIRPP